MKTREFKRPAAELPLPTAHASPGELTKVPPAELAETEPAGLATAESGESWDASKNRAKLRRLAGLFAALAAVFLLQGNELYAMFLAACALGNALEGETRWRVPKLVRVCATALVVVLGIVTVVLMILETRGR